MLVSDKMTELENRYTSHFSRSGTSPAVHVRTGTYKAVYKVLFLPL